MSHDVSRKPSSSRRRLSRAMPWQLPVAALMLLCVFLFGVGRLLGNLRGGPDEVAARELPVGVQVTVPVESTATTSLVEEAPVPQESALEATATSVEATVEAEVILDPNVDPLDDPTVRDSPLEQSRRINILLLGTDGRDEEDGPPRTDLVMVLLVDRTAPRATLISIPRDLWVPIPDYGEGKINTAFFLGSLEGRGTELAQQTVEALLDVEIDRTVQVDFNGFRALVDELGGIEIDVPEAIDDPEFPDGNYGTLHLVIPAGRQQMDGETALRYARTRYGGVDQDRSARQQLVLMAIRERALQPAQLAKAPFLLRTAYRTIDSDLSLADIFALARLGRTMGVDDISMHTLNADGEMVWPTLTWNGQDALMYDPVLLRQTVRQWMRGESSATVGQ